MIKQRLINCDFLNASSFTKLTNKAKLLYLMMITRADDKGFVDTTDDIIEKLNNKDTQEGNVSLELLSNDYVSALVELMNNGYLYEFNDKYGNRVHLIRHWFIHNKWKDRLTTNYNKYFALIESNNGRYYIKKKVDKEKLKQNKLNESNIIETKVKGDKMTDEEWNALLQEIEQPNDESEEI